MPFRASSTAVTARTKSNCRCNFPHFACSRPSLTIGQAAHRGTHAVLAFTKQVGVDHTAGELLLAEWVDVLGEYKLREGEPRRVMANGVKVLLVRRGEKIYGLAEVCSHLGGPLAEGEIEGGTVRCPWHGSRFSLENGCVINGPAAHP